MIHSGVWGFASSPIVTEDELKRVTNMAVVVAKANCGVPRVTGDAVVYSGTPELMQDYARLARDAGARIIGGCCGTSPGHLAAMRKALDAHAPRQRPDLATVIAAQGPLVAPPVAAGRTRRTRRSGGEPA